MGTHRSKGEQTGRRASEAQLPATDVDATDPIQLQLVQPTDTLKLVTRSVHGPSGRRARRVLHPPGHDDTCAVAGANARPLASTREPSASPSSARI
jgi:hypothetical protein